jgi:hypothetical protein
MSLSRPLRHAVLACLCRFALVNLAHAQSNATVTDAATSFQLARQYYDAHRFADALPLFQASYAAQSSPNTLMYIGRCQRQLGHLRDAYVTMSRAAADANQRAIAEPRFTATADAARTEAQSLRGLLAFVTVHVVNAPPSTEVRLDDEPLETSALDQPLPFEPGGLDVRARAPERAPFQRQLQLVAGQSVRIDIELLPMEASPAPAIFVPGAIVSSSTSSSVTSPPRSDVSVGVIVGRPHVTARSRTTPAGRVVGLAGMAAGGAVSIFALVATLFAESEYQRLVALCGEGRCLDTVPGVSTHQNAGRAWQTAANVSWIAGSVLFAAGAVMAIAIRPAVEESEAGAIRNLRIAFDPTGGIAVTGEF